MRFSNDNVTWSPWQGYATPSPWTLTAGDGVKTVYAQYRDGAGNVSGTYSDTIALSSTTATLAFVWNGSGYADLHVQDAAGLTIASTSVSGSGSQLSWYVTVPAGQNYYMVCDYFWDDWEELEGGNYGVWTNNTAINPDGVLSPGETVIWNY